VSRREGCQNEVQSGCGALGATICGISKPVIGLFRSGQLRRVFARRAPLKTRSILGLADSSPNTKPPHEFANPTRSQVIPLTLLVTETPVEGQLSIGVFDDNGVVRGAEHCCSRLPSELEK